MTKVTMTESSIVASSIDGSMRVYDMRKGKLFEIDVGHPINSFDLADKSTFCVASCMDSTTRIVDLEDGAMVAEFSGHKSLKYHSGVKFSHDSKQIIQASEDN